MKPGPTDFADTPGVAWIDGAYVPLAEACVPILDRGFVRSDATYDVAHVWRGSFFRLHDHVERFFASMAALRFDLGMSQQEVADILAGCVSRSGLRDAYVQMTCTRGVPPRGTRDPSLCRKRLYAFAQPFVWIANEAQRREGLRMIVSGIERIAPDRLRRADEVFATSTAGGVMPVTEVDGHAIGAGVPGPVTERLKAFYWMRQEEGWLGTPIVYDAADPMTGGHT